MKQMTWHMLGRLMHRATSVVMLLSNEADEVAYAGMTHAPSYLSRDAAV